MHEKNQHNGLLKVTSGKRYWPDATPVAGQQFEYQFDEIGNRLQAKHGGNASGQNLRTNDYSPNALNQYAAIVDPGYRDVIGRSTKTVPVTVNGQTAERKEEYFRGELSVTNAGGPVWQEVTISGGTNRTGHLLVPPRNQSPVYDADGNLTSDGLWTYTWDGENRLIGMESQTNVIADARKRLTFSYDHQGRRIRKQVETWNGGDWQVASERRFIYDGSPPSPGGYGATFGNLIAELTSDLSPLSSLLWGLDLSGTLQGAGGVGGLLSVAYTQSPSSSHFFCHDGNGNVVALVNAADGKASAQYEYGPFGEMIRATGPMAQTNVFRWSTKYTDDETDLVYYGYRYYSPATGSWLSRDPLSEEGGIKLYGFCNNNPANCLDADGLGVYLPCSKCGRVRPAGANCSCGGSGPETYGTSVDKAMVTTIEIIVPVSTVQALYEGNLLAVAGEYAIGRARIIGRIPGVSKIGNACCAKVKVAIEWLSKPFKYSGGKVIKTCEDAAKTPGLEARGLRPLPGTRQIPEGIPDSWRIRPTKGEGGTWYYDPANKGNAVRVMQGDPASPFPNSQSPYVRWQQNGQALDINGNVVPKNTPDAHIPLQDFKFNPDLFK